MSGRPGEGPPQAAGAGESKLLGRGYQGAVYLRQAGDGPVIVKTPVGTGLLRRARRAMLKREYALYQRLRGIRGIPRCEGFLNGEELVLEYIAGESLREAAHAGPQRQQFFSDLLALIQATHAAGVAHGDLKRKDNILCGPQGRPYLIDFGTAVFVDEQSGPIGRWLFRQVCRMDLNAWFKLKYQRQAGPVDPADERYHRPTLPERAARVVRRGWRAVTLRRRRRRRNS